MKRRRFLKISGTAALAFSSGCATTQSADKPLEIIDCHTHFFDPTRPGGVPWPNKDSELYKPTYVKDYLAQRVPLPVTSTVVVEASSLVEDNQWILDLAQKNSFIVGLCGNLNPLDEAFHTHLRRFAANQRYTGIRVGGGVIAKNLDNDSFIQNLRHLDRLNLQLDINGPPDTLSAIASLADKIPSLRIVIDHLSNPAIDGLTLVRQWEEDMRKVADHPEVYAKVSGLVEAGARSNKPASIDTDFYKGYLDVLWKSFGRDRLVYGSNWPVSGLYAPLYDVQRIVHEYFSQHGDEALRKVFAGNAKVAYGLPV